MNKRPSLHLFRPACRQAGSSSLKNSFVTLFYEPVLFSRNIRVGGGINNVSLEIEAMFLEKKTGEELSTGGEDGCVRRL